MCHGREEIPKRKREVKEGVQLSVLGGLEVLGQFYDITDFDVIEDCDGTFVSYDRVKVEMISMCGEGI